MKAIRTNLLTRINHSRPCCHRKVSRSFVFKWFILRFIFSLYIVFFLLQVFCSRFFSPLFKSLPIGKYIHTSGFVLINQSKSIKTINLYYPSGNKKTHLNLPQNPLDPSVLYTKNTLELTQSLSVAF